jgi:IS1 family transposase
MYTYIGNKETSCYIIYALNKASRKVVDFVVGGRTTENISKVINQIKELNPKCIYTDKLNVYPALMDTIKHITTKYKINRIERMNLNLKTHLKRLSRKTICFSRSKEMLENCLRLYLQIPVKFTILCRFKLTTLVRFKLTTLIRSKLTTY